MQTREARDNVMRVLDLLHGAKTNLLSLKLLSTDAEKAFDRVRWSFMKAVLCKIGIGDRLMTWKNALYSCPSAQVKVNGLLSDLFPIQQWDKTRVPIIAPLIYALPRTVPSHG